MASLTNAGHGPLKVPGFGGIPLDFELPLESRFAHGLVEYRHSPRLTKREMAMLRLMQHITETPGWHRLILDPDDGQLAQWHQDAVEGPEGFLISDLAWDWCISELRDKAKIWQSTGHLLVFDSSSAVCQTDVSRLSLEDLQRQVARLGPQEDHQSPLVDPSLYPLVYARSPVLTRGGHATMHDPWCLTGEVDKELPAHPFDNLNRTPIDLRRRPGYGGPESCYSNRFQWLPCEVEFLSEQSLDVRITSYVNNLNPKSQKNLYGHLEHLITSSIPSWNEILFRGNERGRHPPRILTYGCHIHNYMEDRKIFLKIMHMLHWNALCNTHQEWQNLCDDAREYISGPEPPKWRQAEPRPDLPPNLLDALKPDQWEIPKFVSRLIRCKRARRSWFDHPEPGISFSYDQWKEGQFTGRAIIPQRIHKFDPRVRKFPDPLHHERIPVRLQEQFRKDGLQVVIEVSRIELTPEKPAYSGDAHFCTEGLRNDRIAATSLFVVEAENITPPRIAFEHEDKIHAGEYECEIPDVMATVLDVEHFVSFEEKAPCALHTFGSIPLQEGRLLSWPATFRSKREPFGLADPTRPGNLTTVKIRLVDPHYRICSTRNVPPQQHDWWATEAEQAAGLDKSLPAELVQLVMKETDRWPISREVAVRLREELRGDHERKRKAIDECVGHHLVSYIPYDAGQARDATDSSGVGYESL